MMQAEDFTHYQSWVEAELEVAKGVRKRQWLLFWKVTGIYLAASAVIWLAFSRCPACHPGGAFHAYPLDMSRLAFAFSSHPAVWPARYS